jgi:hypothetical protein
MPEPDGETLFVFRLLLVTIILFVSDRLRRDVVAVLVTLVLMSSDLLSPGEALAGVVSSYLKPLSYAIEHKLNNKGVCDVDKKSTYQWYDDECFR